MELEYSEKKVEVKKEKAAFTMYGTNRSQHSPMSEEREVSYSELKEMKTGDQFGWGTENDAWEVTCIYADEQGSLIRIHTYDQNPHRNEDDEFTQLQYYEWI